MRHESEDEVPRQRRPISLKTACFLCDSTGVYIPAKTVDLFEERNQFAKLVLEFCQKVSNVDLFFLSKVFLISSE